MAESQGMKKIKYKQLDLLGKIKKTDLNFNVVEDIQVITNVTYRTEELNYDAETDTYSFTIANTPKSDSVMMTVNGLCIRPIVVDKTLKLTGIGYKLDQFDYVTITYSYAT